MSDGNLHVIVPKGSIYDLQKSLSGVDTRSFVAPPDGVSDKKPCKWTEIAFHPVRPWVAVIEPKGNGMVWNIETQEIVQEFSLEISAPDGSDGNDMDDDGADANATSTPTITSNARSLLQRASSPTTTSAASYIKVARSKPASLRMLFYDFEAIASTTQSSGERTCFDEWLIVLTSTHIVLCDMNQTASIRGISPDDLHRQVPTSVEILPTGLIAIGCQDGKLRIWSPKLWKTVETIETSNSVREIQHLMSLPTNDVHYLVGASVDGKIFYWKTTPIGLSGCEVLKVGEIDLKDHYRAFDTTNGLHELKCHALQEMMSGTMKDGTAFFFDATPLLRQGKSAPLVGILPATKASGAIVVASAKKGSFLVVSAAPSGTTLLVSELVNKGRVVGKDNVPSSYHEFAVAASFETKDVRLLMENGMQKPKLRIVTLASNPTKPIDFCCLTTYGMLSLQLNCLPHPEPIFIDRGADKAPLVAYAGTARIAVRFVGEETSSKQEDYKLQSGLDAPNEKMKTPSLEPAPSNPSVLSALLPASTHLEILHMDSELRNQKSINFHMAFSGNAVSIAWHARQSRFAILVPHEPDARRLTRATSAAVPTPRRRGFMFGGNKGANEDTGDNARLKNAMARAVSLAIYDISKDGVVELVDDNCGGPDEHMLYLFSGPVLGIVRYEADDDAPSTETTNATDSPSNLRSRRAESSVFGASIMSSTTSSSITASNIVNGCDGNELTKTFLEFYEWDTVTKDPEKHHATLKQIGCAVDCPLQVVWEKTTKTFCALVYPSYVAIYRISSHDGMLCLHEIPTAQTVQSVLWFHHTLFLAMPDAIQCLVICKTKYFAFVLAARDAGIPTSDHEFEFPKPQLLPRGATTLLGVKKQQLVLTGATQQLYTLDLSNKVLQCCLLISIGQCDLALQLTNAGFGLDVRLWIASVLEAFGFVSQAMQVDGMTIETKIDMCIKHNLVEQLPSFLAMISSDSSDLVGTSPFQRGCMALLRSDRKDELSTLLASAQHQHHSNNTIFLTSLLRKDQQLVHELVQSTRHYATAFHLNHKIKHANPSEILTQWNQSIQAPNAKWRQLLDQHQDLRSPDFVTLVAP